MKISFYILAFLLLSACNNEDNVIEVENCKDQEIGGYAGVTIKNDKGFSESYWCQFKVDETCEKIKTAKRIEIVGQGFMQKLCEIKK